MSSARSSGEGGRDGSARLAGGAERVGSASARLARAWRGLPSERRLAALAAGGLFVSLFLPWYQETVIADGVTRLRSASISLTGWAAFSFVEAAVLLVAAGVLTLLFLRAEGRAFHVPGGDGGVITAAGFWTCVLVVWRMFDKQGTSRHGLYATTSGIEWGIFIALGVAGVLTYAGSRIRRAHDPEPPLPGEAADSPGGGRPAPGGPAAGGGRSGAPGPPVSLWERAARKAFGPPAGESPRPDRRAGGPPGRRAAAPGPPRPDRAAGEPRPDRAAGEPLPPDRRPVRAPEMEADGTWTLDAPPRRRVRPRSVAAGLDRSQLGDLDIADPPTSPLTRSRPTVPRLGERLDRAAGLAGSGDGGPSEAGSEAATVRLPGEEAATVRLPGDEATTNRLRRERPPGRDAEPPEDQLTMRLDRPN